MKIGYPCINRSVGCTANHTFRLKSYSESRLIETIEMNLECLLKILEYNVQFGFYFFRISSDIIPFASHPVNQFNWAEFFSEKFKTIGNFIKDNAIRISMHPDQFVLLNSLKKDVVERSIDELQYHAHILDLIELNADAKIQIHVGGVYGNKKDAIARFKKNYEQLQSNLKKRLVIENDERLYSLQDCLFIHHEIGIPILFDAFHHECFNNLEPLSEAIHQASSTWKPHDGILMVDYSSQETGTKKGRHAQAIDLNLFKKFLQQTKGLDFDIMLEIKDKEKSALKALEILNSNT